MKIRANWLVITAVALSLGACKKKPEVTAPETPVAVATAADTAPPAATPAVKLPALSPEQRAAKLGFVQHLPPDTEVVMTLLNGAKSVEHIQASKLWQLVQAQMGVGIPGEGMGPIEGMPDVDGKEPDGEEMQLPDGEPDAAVDAAQELLPISTTTPATLPVADQDQDQDQADAAVAASEPRGPAALFGTEFTIALGKSAGAQTANLLTGYRRMGYFQMRMLAKAFAAAAKDEDFSALEKALGDQYGTQLLKDLLADPESGIALIERLQMPPLYLAFRTSAADRAGAAQQLAAMVANLGMMEEMVEPVEVEKAGRKFMGMKISGAKIAEQLEQERAGIEATLEPATLDKLLAALTNKDLVVVSGILGDYAVLFIGSSVDELNFAADPAQSLVASDALAFCDAYASKELAAVIYGQKGALDQLIAGAGGLSDMAGGLRDGLAGADGLGDTRDLEALLRMVGEREAAVRKLAGNEALGVAAFFEDGLKIESFGGNDHGAVDWQASNKLAALGDAEEVVMFLNMTTAAAYDEQARAYMEVLMETAYALAMKVADVPMQDEKMVKFKELAKLIDGRFRPDAVALWDAFSGNFGGSLGHECACVVDLNGSVPTLPGIPQAVVDAGKFPRISVLAPVTDRAQLAASWQQMNTHATSLLANISGSTDKEIPLQKPISSEKDGYTTWFFSLPYCNDDFMPSVTVGDKWFAASSSKNQALDLVTKAAAGGATRSGLCFTMNFKALRKFSRATLKLLDENAAAIFDEDATATDKMATAGKLIEALEDLDKLTVHVRREGGMLRSSVHFKTL